MPASRPGRSSARDCRVYRPPEVTEAMRHWWLERYALDELRELAASMWPGG